MLPTKRRVKKEFFPEIMKKGLVLSSQHFYLHYLDRKDSKTSLFSFVVPSKVRKTSVGRHLIKRKMSVVIERNITKFRPGFSVIVMVKKDPATLSYSQIEKEILDLVSFLGYTH